MRGFRKGSLAFHNVALTFRLLVGCNTAAKKVLFDRGASWFSGGPFMIYLGGRASQVGKLLDKSREGAINDFVLIS